MRAGVSGATIWKWEHGECNPRPRLISALVKALQVPVSSLIAPAGGDEPLAVIPGPEAQERLDPVLSQPELLADVIAQAKQMIAKAAGNSPDKILIRLDF
jgi:transcriptional regulator with XRE-family HTH domain